MLYGARTHKRRRYLSLLWHRKRKTFRQFRLSVLTAVCGKCHVRLSKYTISGTSAAGQQLVRVCLCRRFRWCTWSVKLRLFRTFCVCFYDTALWSDFSAGALSRLVSCYSKCVKCFFGYSKYSSVTGMLFELGLRSVSTLMHNYKVGFTIRLAECDNAIVRCILQFHL